MTFCRFFFFFPCSLKGFRNDTLPDFVYSRAHHRSPFYAHAGAGEGDEHAQPGFTRLPIACLVLVGDLDVDVSRPDVTRLLPSVIKREGN